MDTEVTGAALRFNSGKPELSKLFEFGNALDNLVKVMTQGAIKYDDGNWLKGGQDAAQFLNSAMRHIKAYANGEVYDQDIGCHHLALASWNLMAAQTILHPELPTLDPEFDQDSFVAQYNETELATGGIVVNQAINLGDAGPRAIADDIGRQLGAEPDCVIDDDGDHWYLQDAGGYRIGGSPEAYRGSAFGKTIDYIEELYGPVTYG